MSARIVGAALLLIVLAAASGEAQAKHVGTCAVDSSGAWFRKQRAWLDESAKTWTNDTARTALLSAAGVDASRKLPVQLGWEINDAGAGMSAEPAVAQLKALAATRGSVWPVRSVVGAAGVHAVYLLSARDTGLARASLHRMMEAGPDESPAADVAVMEDRLRLLSGRKQIYGTQFHSGSSVGIELAPMEDSAHVDLRREDAGLPPFRVSACLARAGARLK